MINDDQLTLYFYDDGLSDHERQHIAQALEQDAALAARYAALAQELEQLRHDAYTSVVSDDFSASLHNVLVQADAPTRATSWRRWSVAAVLLAAVALSVTLMPRAPTESTPVAATVPLPPNTAAPSSQRIVVAHLAQSRLQLVRYSAADAAVRSELIRELVEQNRSIERAAQRNGDDDLARVLRAFETVLERLASAPEQADEREQLLDQLTFELNTMLTKFDAPASDPTISF